MTKLIIHANGKIEIVRGAESVYGCMNSDNTYGRYGYINSETKENYTAHVIDEAIFKEKASKILSKEIKEIQNEINKLNVRKKKFERAYLKIKESE